MVVAARALADAGRLTAVYRPLTRAMCAGAGAAAVVGWVRPAPWLLALLLGAILSALWVFAVGASCAPAPGPGAQPIRPLE